MRVLILSFYYPPDLCAGSFRCGPLVDALLARTELEIEVVTTLPNRYSTFSVEAAEYEHKDRLTIHRLKLPEHKSGMIDQMNSFRVFYKKALRITNGKDYDMVFATSSRLFTAYLGSVIVKKRKAPLYLDVRDIFADTLADILPKVLWALVRPVIKKIEEKAFSEAAIINLVSNGFFDYFQNNQYACEFRRFTNGIDDEFLNFDTDQSRDEEKLAKDNFPTILYAGNIGEGQALESIVPALAKKLLGKGRIRIVGDGGRRLLLENLVKAQELQNVYFVDPIPRESLKKEYLNADVLFLHLQDVAAFEKVLPSKIFEYAATGKPILAGVKGYSKAFIEENIENASVFHPGDVSSALTALERLDFATTARSDFVKNYSRKKIMSEMAEDISKITENYAGR